MRFARLLIPLIVCGLLLLALGLLTASAVPFDAARRFMDARAADGSAEVFTVAVHHTLRLVAVLTAVGGLAAGAPLWVFRTRIEQRVGADAAEFIRELRGWRIGRGSLVLLLLLTAVGTGLRAIYLSQPMRWDEAYSYLTFVDKPLVLTVSAYSDPNNHVLHSLLVWISVRLFGNEPWAIRLPAFLAGVLSVPACYFAGRALYSDRVGLLAAGLTACSSYLIEYSTNARGYTLQTLLTLLCLAIAATWRRRRNVVAWGLFALLSALGFWTLPTMLYSFAGIVAWLALCALLPASGEHQLPVIERSEVRDQRSEVRDQRSEVRDQRSEVRGQKSEACAPGILWFAGVVVVTVLLTVFLYLPVIGTVGPNALVANKYVTALPFEKFLAGSPEMLTATWERFNRDIPLFISLPLAVAALLSMIWHRRVSFDPLSAIPTILVVCVLLITLQRVLPYPRVWLFLIPLYWIQAAAGVVWLLESAVSHKQRRHTAARQVGFQWGMIGLVAVICVPIGYGVILSGSVLESRETGVLPDAAAVAELLRQELRPGERIVAPVPSSTQLQYYVRKDVDSPWPIISNEMDDLPRDRVIVVVSRGEGQTLNSVAAQHGLPRRFDLSSARLLRQYPSAAVYDLKAK